MWRSGFVFLFFFLPGIYCKQHWRFCLLSIPHILQWLFSSLCHLSTRGNEGIIYPAGVKANSTETQPRGLLPGGWFKLMGESSYQLWMWTWSRRHLCSPECARERKDSPFQDEDWACHVPSLSWAADKDKNTFYKAFNDTYTIHQSIFFLFTIPWHPEGTHYHHHERWRDTSQYIITGVESNDAMTSAIL